MKYFVAPLNWGLGHAVRCVPIVRKLLSENHCVVLGGDGVSGEYLRNQFPELEFVELPHLNVVYSSGKSQILPILKLLPKLLFVSVKEHLAISKIVKEKNINVVFSDNRFGLFTKECKSIYMTHQLNIIMPKRFTFLESFGRFLHRLVINNYSECLVPDFESEENLSGRLSHSYKNINNLRFIGPISRFENCQTVRDSFKYKYLFILSGVEPQRTILENKLIEIFDNMSDVKCALVRGKQQCLNTKYIDVYKMLDDKSLGALIDSSETIVCRSGYTSVMELFILKKKAILIPTPGQTEQEYLAEYLSEKYKYLFSMQNQKDITKQSILDYECPINKEIR